jgi:hypothetical protein
MAFTPQAVITEVRRLVQDERQTYRYSDPFILGSVNQVLKRICLLRPDLFAVVDEFTCVAGSVQTVPDDGVRIIDIFMNAENHVVHEINRQTLDLMFMTWQGGTPGPATNWMRHVRSPRTFFVYPPSAEGQILTIEYAQSPPDYAIDDSIALLTDAYFTSVVDGTVWLLESVDNEHVNSGRAKMFQDAFTQSLGVTVQAKSVTDSELGGQPKEEVM